MIHNKWVVGFYCGIFAVLWQLCKIPFWTSVGYTSFSVWLVWSGFNHFIWRICPGLFGRKKISGKWIGQLKSNFKGATSKDVEVRIKQTFSSINITLKTNEIVSKSVITGWDKTNNSLYYIYKTDPDISIKRENPVQDGAAKIVFDKANKKELKIEYWTDRKTTGYIQLRKVSWLEMLKFTK